MGLVWGSVLCVALFSCGLIFKFLSFALQAKLNHAFDGGRTHVVVFDGAGPTFRLLLLYKHLLILIVVLHFPVLI